MNTKPIQIFYYMCDFKSYSPLFVHARLKVPLPDLTSPVQCHCFHKLPYLDQRVLSVALDHGLHKLVYKLVILCSGDPFVSEADVELII